MHWLALVAVALLLSAALRGRVAPGGAFRAAG